MKTKEIKFIKDVLNSCEGQSTCYYYPVGAVIVKDGRIISTGWNGTPRNMLECSELEKFIYFLKYINYVYFIKRANISYRRKNLSYNEVIDFIDNNLSIRNFNLIYNLEKLRIEIDDKTEIKTFRNLIKDVINILKKYKDNSKTFSDVISNFKLMIEIAIHGDVNFENIIHSKYEIHAEQNAIAFAAKNGISLEGAAIFCSYLPCMECAKIIVQSGIKEVYYKNMYIDKRFGINSIEFLKKSGIKVKKLNKEDKEK